MSQLRQDRTTGAWVIIAPERGRRGQRETAAAYDRLLIFDPACPFCPGNESMLPGIIEETPIYEPPGWRVRVVPNKYPVLRPEMTMIQHAGGDHTAVAGYGFHEVVIESSRHDADLACMSDVEIGAVLSTCLRRFVSLAARPRIKSVLLFRNYGPTSGASLAHPHTQLVALAMIPPYVRSRDAWARAWHQDHGRCILCDELDLEQKDARRIVEEAKLFIALVPFAATCPFELWLVPKRHQASFAEISEGELSEIGPLLRNMLRRLKSVLGDPPYNFVVESGGKPEVGRPDLHWRLRIAPSLTTPGGFELTAGMPINPSSPEDDAKALRSAGGIVRRV